MKQPITVNVSCSLQNIVLAPRMRSAVYADRRYLAACDCPSVILQCLSACIQVCYWTYATFTM